MAAGTTEPSDACQRFACNIQTCLAQNGYDESRCTTVIDDLYACCQRFYKERGTDAPNKNCPKFDLLQLKREQRREQNIDAKLVHPKGARK